MFSNDTFSLCVINPAKPPAKVSPALLDQNLFNGKAGAKKT
jgi:hypothetical protein